MLVSIVTTVRNEERNLAALLDSLLVQEPPFEVLIVEAYSEDKTWEIAKDYASRHPDTVRALRQGGSRGEGRNFGIGEAGGDFLTTIPCRDATYLQRGVKSESLKWISPVVAGRT